MARYKVKAPLVLAKDTEGKVHERYAGAVIGWLHPTQEKHFLALGMVVKLDDPEPAESAAPAAQGASPAGKPAKAAGVEAWVEYGVSKLGEEKRAELVALGAKDKQELIGLLS